MSDVDGQRPTSLHPPLNATYELSMPNDAVSAKKAPRTVSHAALPPSGNVNAGGGAGAAPDGLSSSLPISLIFSLLVDGDSSLTDMLEGIVGGGSMI